MSETAVDIASSHSRAIEQSRTIVGLIDELRLAQHSMPDGPHVLDLINELSFACEELFDAREDELDAQSDKRLDPVRLLHSNFLASLADYAEQIRLNNGELDAHFFDFLNRGPISILRPAA